MNASTERCENCGGIIGKLETPCVWSNSVVCRACHDRLENETRSNARNMQPTEPTADDVAAAIRQEQAVPDYASRPQRRAYTKSRGWIIGSVGVLTIAVAIAVYVTTHRSTGKESTVPTPSKTKADHPTLRSLDYVLSVGNIANMDWRFKTLPPENDAERDERRVRSPKVKAEEFAKWVKPNDPFIEADERKLINAKKSVLKEVVAETPRLFGTDDGFLDECPVRFFAASDGVGVLVVGGGIDTVFNTLKLTDRQMATKIVRDRLIPQLESMARSAGDLGVVYVGASITHFRKDFSKEYLSEDIQTVLMVSSTSVLEKFSAREITEDELADKSQIFLSGGGRFVLVKLKFE